MKTMPAGEFKAHCLRVMDQVRASREPVIITKKGVPVAKLVPASEPQLNVFGCMAGTADILGDVEAPVVPVRTWKTTK
ncbi:MAG: type II toxin-antitoxin system Phd/YefM family antitoxin [Candidatus Binatia bacterium]